jgi:gluconate kinase
MDMRARLWGHIDYYDVGVSILEVDSKILQRMYYNRFHYFKTYAHRTQFLYLYTPSRSHYSLSMINTKTDTSLVDNSSSPRFR